MTPLPDYHIHTALCQHATGEIHEYRARADRLKIPEICFTDHVPSPDGYDPEHRMAMADFPNYREMIRRLQRRDVLPGVLFGIEADYYEGCERFLKTWLPAQGFDYVLGSVHFIRGWGFDNPEERHIWDSVDVTATWRKYFEAITQLARSGLFDAVGHLDLPKKFGYRPPNHDLKIMTGRALDSIAAAGMGLEINTAGLRKPVGEIYPSPEILSLARKKGIPICFGSDAHSPAEVGADFEIALGAVRQAGYGEYFTIRHRKKRLVPLPE